MALATTARSGVGLLWANIHNWDRLREKVLFVRRGQDDQKHEAQSCKTDKDPETGADSPVCFTHGNMYYALPEAGIPDTVE